MANAMFYTSGSQSGRNRPTGSDFDGQGGEKNKGGYWGTKQHKGGENTQPLIDHWVNFSAAYYYDLLVCCKF